MHTDLKALQITQDELEQVAGLDFSDGVAIAAYQAILFRKPSQIWAIVQIEFFVLLLTLIFLLPSSLLVLRSVGYVPNPSGDMSSLFVVVLSFSLLAVLVWNIYLWKHAKLLKTAARLVHEVGNFNNTVQTMCLIDRLEPAQSLEIQPPDLDDREEAIAALRITRENLISALKAEKMLRRHPQLVDRHDDVVAVLETNLTTLMTFGAENQMSEYRQLCNDALKISVSVHRQLQRR